MRQESEGGSTDRRIGGWWTRARSAVRSVVGAPDYEAYLEHCRQALHVRHNEVERLAVSAPEARALNFASSLPLTRDYMFDAERTMRFAGTQTMPRPIRAA